MEKRFDSFIILLWGVNGVYDVPVSINQGVGIHLWDEIYRVVGIVTGYVFQQTVFIF